MTGRVQTWSLFSHINHKWHALHVFKMSSRFRSIVLCLPEEDAKTFCEEVTKIWGWVASILTLVAGVGSIFVSLWVTSCALEVVTDPWAFWSPLGTVVISRPNARSKKIKWYNQCFSWHIQTWNVVFFVVVNNNNFSHFWPSWWFHNSRFLVTAGHNCRATVTIGADWQNVTDVISWKKLAEKSNNQEKVMEFRVTKCQKDSNVKLRNIFISWYSTTHELRT